ncbi:EamA family transporter [Sinomonas sp. JGH33]|uniref:EamA family transporter n=1 Tax=Sinomonas terricola TaxID=3110330 RepID=A0ABU5T9R5_9MICC|nr:EamA family transporter [Sinomonas sp. JGH33]MEA5456414.1 EamA family transporter [Sinomonas sp. JGH33]
MKPRHSALAVLVAVIWGVNFIAIELGLRDVPPLVFAALRFALVAVPAMLFVPKPAVPWRVIAGVGLFMSAGQFGLVYLAMHSGMPAGLAPLVLQSQMLFTILLAGAVLKERPTTAQLAGVGAGAVGLVLVAVGRGAVAPIGPLVLVVLAGFSWGIGNTISRAAKGASGLGIVVWSAAVVPVPMLALAAFVDRPGAVVGSLAHLTLPALLSTLFTVVLASLVGYTAWNSLLGKYPAAAVVPYTLLVPPVGMLAAWLAFGEVPQPLEIVGGAVLLTGVGTTLVRRRESRKRVPEAALADVSP